MAGKNVPVVLMPRWTSFVGVGTFAMSPVPVAAYEDLVISYMTGNVLGTTPTLTFQFQESNDLQAWSDCSTTPFALVVPFVEGQHSARFTKAWFRVNAVLGGTNPSVSCWMQGFLVRREK